MYKIALTGGIGTGKTYLSKHFVQMGIPVFYADDEAKRIYDDAEFVQRLVIHFGPEICSADGRIVHRALASIVFQNAEKLQLLNQLVHPWVMKRFEAWSLEQQSASVVMESAIIFEGNLTHHFDKIIVVDAPLELRIRRIQGRNPELSREEIIQRISKQIPQEEKCRRADLVICTGETYCEIEKL